MSPERRVKSDGRYYRGIRANPDLCDGPATKYVGYFRREKRPGQSIANTRRSLRFRSRAELHSDRFTCRCIRLLYRVSKVFDASGSLCFSTKQQCRSLSETIILARAPMTNIYIYIFLCQRYNIHCILCFSSATEIFKLTR